MSRHFPVIVGAGQLWSLMPAARTEFLGQQNREISVPAANRKRLRLQTAGGIDGHTTAVLGADYFSVGGGIWVDTGIVVSCLVFGGSEVTQTSAWVDLPEEAQIDGLRLRVMGSGGNGAANPTFSYLIFELGSEALFPSNSLEGCPTGRDFVFFGGSQIGGGGNPAEFGTVDPAIPAALDPLFVLGHGAGGVTYVKNGVVQTAVPTEHGAEIGFMYALHLAGKLAGSRVVCRYVSGTNAAAWVGTHFATVVADVAAQAGMSPVCAFYVLGSTDANSDSTVGLLDNFLRALQGLLSAAWDPCGWVAMGQVTTDGVTFPRLAEARVVGERRFEDTAGEGKRAWVDFTGVALQVTDQQHPTSAGHVDQGTRYAAPVLAYGIPG